MTSLIALAAASALAVQVAPTQEPGWTWTLYESDGPLVLANELPDTPRLRATFECEPGSGVARLSLYGVETRPGFATASAGQASAAVEVTAGRERELRTALRVDHPVFAAFLAGGRLNLVLPESVRTVEVERPALPRLQRFAALCAG